MAAGEASADLEEGLAITLGQLVEDQATGRVGECAEWVSHGSDADDMQVHACMSNIHVAFDSLEVVNPLGRG